MYYQCEAGQYALCGPSNISAVDVNINVSFSLLATGHSMSSATSLRLLAVAKSMHRHFCWPRHCLEVC
ncbi:hypothetical protein EDC52_106174 [Biostraticola tofi]|uniref:Uncharacterized protein n=1 Tax=Biostraticola tofi TaxID=466109 RepID=A0A4R3YVJ3_9GAMM|nr:hypothetical protein EDC52_106174 [Biostraticola tofi]